MAEKEKCFCHLNGFKVKDTDARKVIDEHNVKIAEIDEKVKTNTAHYASLEIDITTLQNENQSQQNEINNNSSDITSLKSRVGTLESSGGSSGGGKIYRHKVFWTPGPPDIASITFLYYSSSSTPLTTDFLLTGDLSTIHILPESYYDNTGYSNTYLVTRIHRHYQTGMPIITYMVDTDLCLTQSYTVTTEELNNWFSDTVTEV